MAELVLTETGALMRCERCGGWREVRLEPAGADAFFAHFRATLTCCGLEQTATAAREKDEIDVH
uniref:Uncharacterized protein n=1 Tax=Desulfobacca acetoxidans TaxID=60893 RepID=A0A7V4G7W3_9BACT